MTSEEADRADHELLVTIADQTRATLELVRSLVALMLPKDGPKGPTLEQLLAAVLGQQREIIAEVQETRQTLLRIAEAMPQAVAEAMGENDQRAGVLRPC